MLGKNFKTFVFQLVIGWVAVLCASSVFAQSFTPDQQKQLDQAKLDYARLGQLLKQAKYNDAADLAKQILRVRETHLGREHPDTAICLNDLGFAFQGQGKLDEALPLYREVLQIREKTLGPEHEGTAVSLNNLANLYHGLGMHDDALSHYQRALKISDKVLAPDHKLTATCLNNLANLYKDRGSWTTAINLAQRALEMKERKFGPNHPQTAKSLNSLASLYSMLGSFDKALSLFQRQLKICETAHGVDHPVTAQCLNDLGLHHIKSGDTEKGLEYHQRALRIRKKALGPEHLSTAFSLHNVAFAHQMLDAPDKAAPLLEQAISIWRQAVGPEHPYMAASLNSLACLCEIQGSLDKANSLYRQSLDIRKNVYGPNHPDTIISLNNLALLEGSRRNARDCSELLDQVRRSAANHVARLLPSLSITRQQKFLQENYDRAFHVALSFGTEFQDELDEARSLSAAWLANGKAIGQQALAQRNLLMRDVGDRETAQVARELIDVRDRLAKLSMSTAGATQAQSRQQMLQQLTQREDQLARQLEPSRQNSSSAGWIELDDIRSNIPADSALVDIGRFDRREFRAAGDGKRWKPAHYAAWITRRDQTSTQIVDLGPAEEIEALVERVRKQLRNSAKDLARFGEADSVGVLQVDTRRLSEKIWQPIADQLPDVENVILSPDGMLWLVPWSALPVQEPEQQEIRYLIEKYNIRLVTSARDLLATSNSRPTKRPIIVADPDYDQQQAAKRDSIQRMFRKVPTNTEPLTQELAARSVLPSVIRLPNTSAEADAIKPRIEAYTSDEPIVYQDRWALEHVVKRLKSPRVASFSTHGFFLPKQELVTSDSDDISTSSTRSVVIDKNNAPLENPLLRCGLLLAGCNDRNSVVGDDDGILTGLEITGIDFRGTELVVLSACETGLGDVRNGEGVAGLRQAFQLAGAESVVSSLWNVADEETARLMKLFFDNLAEGMSKSEALRQAQLTRIKPRRTRHGAAHPFFWAAFTLTGQD